MLGWIGKKSPSIYAPLHPENLKKNLSTNANPFLSELYHKACPNPTHLSELC